jgi:hypothetical protein
MGTKTECTHQGVFCLFMNSNFSKLARNSATGLSGSEVIPRALRLRSNLFAACDFGVIFKKMGSAWKEKSLYFRKNAL